MLNDDDVPYARRFKMDKQLILCSVVMLVLLFQCSDALAFDGARRGFFLGGSLGAAHATRMFRYGDESVLGIQTNLAIGHGVSNKFLLGYSGLQFWGVKADEGDLVSSSAVFGIIPSWAAWYYLQNSYPSAYVKGGIGLAILPGTDGSGDCCDLDGGFAPHLALGYEFGRAMSVDATVVYFDEPNTPDDYILVAIMLNAIAF